MPIPHKWLIIKTGVTYAILDTYDDTQSAPITTPRVLENGYPTVTGESRLSIASGDLVGTEDNGGVSGVAYSDNASAGITIADGMLFGFDRESASSTSLGGGFRSTTAMTGIYTSWTLGTNYSVTLYYSGAFYNFAVAEFGADVVIAYLFDSSRCFVFTYNNGDVTPAWELRIVVPALSGAYYASVQLCINAASGTSKFRRLAMRNDVAGVLTGVSCGTSAGSTASAPSADFVAYIEVTTIPTAGADLEFRFRIQDATHYWALVVDQTTGTYHIDEVNGGAPVTHATSVGAVADGEKLVLSAAGNVLDAWANATRIRYASASNFNTETAVELEALGTGGAVGSITMYKYYPSGDIQTALETMRDSS